MDSFVPKCKSRDNETIIDDNDRKNLPDRLKLFTIFYGLMGMPMFIYSICRIGDSLSLSTMNFQLRFVHYAIKLPFYLLRQLIRLMCCLCCCCYCCGLLAITTQSIFLIPCLKPQRPKLNLYKPLELIGSRKSTLRRHSNVKQSKKSEKKKQEKKGNYLLDNYIF